MLVRSWSATIAMRRESWNKIFFRTHFLHLSYLNFISYNMVANLSVHIMVVLQFFSQAVLKLFLLLVYTHAFCLIKIFSCLTAMILVQLITHVPSPHLYITTYHLNFWSFILYLIRLSSFLLVWPPFYLLILGVEVTVALYHTHTHSVGLLCMSGRSVA
jgi:hypothetical protein